MGRDVNIAAARQRYIKEENAPEQEWLCSYTNKQSVIPSSYKVTNTRSELGNIILRPEYKDTFQYPPCFLTVPRDRFPTCPETTTDPT